jgi:hypothetical protein
MVRPRGIDYAQQVVVDDLSASVTSVAIMGSTIQRRDFLRTAGGSLAFAAAAPWTSLRCEETSLFQTEQTVYAPTFSVIPVVGDGNYIWTKPPIGETGYLEPRRYELKLGIELEGTGDATELKATTVAPLTQPGQKIEKAHVETVGCEAMLRQVDNEAGQLFLAAPSITKGQKIAAAAIMELTVSKEYFGYTAEKFPSQQKVSREITLQAMADSPGIQTRIAEVRKLAGEITASIEHPWDKAAAFHDWVWQNIKARPGYYTSVVAALRDKVGDCEERACVFIALCRAVGIPARQVWVPNHAWAEFYLQDEAGEGHWIPAHTSCYSWFGWTGAHEVILQKGDRVRVPEQHSPMRLLADWMQQLGAKPRVRYLAELTPLPTKEGEDAGPGARVKDANGQWQLRGTHALDKYMRV